MFNFLRKLMGNKPEPAAVSYIPRREPEHRVVDPRLRSFMISEIISDATFKRNITYFDDDIQRNLEKFSFDVEFCEELKKRASSARSDLIVKAITEPSYRVSGANFWALNNNSLRPALASDYCKWLRGFIQSGGKPTHYYNRSMDDDFYVATGSITMLPLCGASSINIIVPNGIEITGHDRGHINVYYMNGFKHSDYCFIPLYDDIATML